MSKTYIEQSTKRKVIANGEPYAVDNTQYLDVYCISNPNFIKRVKLSEVQMVGSE